MPYFVQLTQVVIADLFGQIARDHHDFLAFPRGFIASTVVMPADFCELGIARFEDDLDRFSYIRAEILDSLKRAGDGASRLASRISAHPRDRVGRIISVE